MVARHGRRDRRAGLHHAHPVVGRRRAMFANRSGLQAATLRNVLLGWVLTVPATVLLGSVLFAASLYAILSFAD
ncbi:MAG: hypothetical protein J0J01_23150 [Reyranella sp.]|nr:hypothetical protein [Reyranella sp.]